ncbi:response regulator transcription factor [Permianibacter sp. IMCC34836]|uniref:response regulator transcription factor n=1 Tax=Permianibacter fluminis TaxID=2738515 RepID=UPI001553A387|nr:sigma-70 family RNA polymerase sigma factor [Permianibacter fluminis]NQD38979.1 response regulator transcription factor [Permianibacter fluminis]
MTDSASPTVHIVDDDAAVRDSLALLLELSGLPVRSFDSAESFLAELDREASGCLLLDLRMPGMDGLSLQKLLTERGIGLPIVMITAHGDVAAARTALKGGAVDFLEKPVDETVLLATVREAMQREQSRVAASAEQQQAHDRLARLTEREREVLELVAAGRTSKEIGEQLGISPRTVEVYRARLMDKLQVGSLPELVRLALAARPG